MSAQPHSRLVFRLVGLVAFMGAMSFAAVPLYDWFCRVTGYGGTTAVAEGESELVLDRTIKVRFDASTARDLPWRFEPMQREVEIRIGETGIAYYEATNLSDEPVAGTASFNVVPFSAGSYFAKIACFCFTEQVLQPGETVRMPVTFFVDPEIVDDPEAKHATAITLSYTFYRDEITEVDAAGTLN